MSSVADILIIPTGRCFSSSVGIKIFLYMCSSLGPCSGTGAARSVQHIQTRASEAKGRLPDSGLRHTFARKAQSCWHKDWTRGLHRDSGSARGGGVREFWRTPRRKGARAPVPRLSANAEAGPSAEITKRSGHGDRTHHIRHHHD